MLKPSLIIIMNKNNKKMLILNKLHKKLFNQNKILTLTTKKIY
jgi:hypothetical protein